jgi:NitT/TauT family transport system substrate-binding protein
VRKICAALLGSLVASLQLSAAEPAPDALRVYGNTSTIELAPVLLAVDRIHPSPVRIVNGGVPNLFKPGEAELATNAETQALRASVDNPGLRIILTVSEGWYRIVARRSAGISKLADLKGKRIATFPNTSSAYYLSRMLATVGVSDRDVTIVPTGPGVPLSGLADMLEKHEVDAVTIWEPEIQNAAERLGADAIEFQDRKVYRELFNLHATAAELADPVQRKRIVAFVRSVLVATKQLHQDPTQVWPLVSKSSHFDQALIAKVWHHEGYPGTLVPDLLDVLEAEEVYVARERNRTPRTRAELAPLIDDSVLKEVLAAEPSLRVKAPTPEQVHAQTNRLRARQ